MREKIKKRVRIKLQSPIDWPKLVELTYDAAIASKALAILVRETHEIIAIVEKMLANQKQKETSLLLAYVHKLAGAAHQCMAYNLTGALFRMEIHLRKVVEKKVLKVNWKRMEELLAIAKKESVRIERYYARKQQKKT